MLLTIDSSVVVASIMEKEKYHESCERTMEKISDAEHSVVIPYSVLVEVAASVRRRANSEKLADELVNDLKNMDTIYFLELTKERALEAANIAKTTGLKGMDAIVVQIAKENNATLVTLDDEIMNKAKKVANVVHIETFDALDVKDVPENNNDGE